LFFVIVPFAIGSRLENKLAVDVRPVHPRFGYSIGRHVERVVVQDDKVCATSDCDSADVSVKSTRECRAGRVRGESDRER
jgi:hypothetical protein